MSQKFDVVVIGGGHAGAEAARVVARGGLTVAVVTMERLGIGRMSCNPAIGGLAKGHLVREIDALGGLMAEATDAAGIQFKVLNRSKGPAVQGPRAQCDRDLYAAAVLSLLDEEPNLRIIEGTVSELLVASNRVAGVELDDGSVLMAHSVILTTGTFLRGLMHSGETKTAGGRWGELAATTLSASLARLGLILGRLKTGTPPRVFRDSVDFSQMEIDPGDQEPRPFSILTDRIAQRQVPCHLTWTDSRTHELILENLHRAPMYSGQIQGTGPRYCPSIEDKVVRFADKARHHVFVEPEGLNHPWLYLNGVSTSLPMDVQDKVVHSLPGFGEARIARYGYAVEYDFVNPEQLEATLKVRGVDGLYLAGQINGTSGYEEAGAQGLIAGINALLEIRGNEPFVLRRDQAYIGVMIDDLVTLGTEEPYRMFTSRAEYRLLLGCDSVYERLSPQAGSLGILDAKRRIRTESRVERMTHAREALLETAVFPDSETNQALEDFGIEIQSPTTIAKLLQRDEFSLDGFLATVESSPRMSEVVDAIKRIEGEEREGVLNQARYAGYIERQLREAERLHDDEALVIPSDFTYDRPGLSNEAVEKLTFVRPRSLGQAARVAGVTPAAVSILRMHLRQGFRELGRSNRAV